MDPINKKPHQRLFIYDVREILSLFFLGLMATLFTFTLGLHFGKRINSHPTFAKGKDAIFAKALADAIPDKEHFLVDSQGKHEIREVLEDVLTQELHEEVVRSGLKLSHPQIVDLPEKPKTSNEGATTLGAARDEGSAAIAAAAESATEGNSPVKKSRYPSSAGSGARAHRETPKFTLQIGAYSSKEEAKHRLEELNDEDYEPILREVNLKGKGKWYRLYLGEFNTRLAAQKAGEEYHSQHVIENFVISPWVD